MVRDFPREEKGTLTRQYIPLKLFRNGRGIKRTAGRGGATLNYHPRGYGKIIATNDENVPPIYRFLFSFLSLSRYLFILLFSIFYPRQIMNMLASLYLLNFNNIFNYEFPFILNFEMLAKNF